MQQPAHREARFLIALVLIFGVIAAMVILPYLNTLTLAIVIGICFMPLAERLKRHMKRPGLASLLTLVIALVLVITPLAFFGYRAAGEAIGVYTKLTQGHTFGELSGTTIPLEGVAAHLPAAFRDALPQGIDLGPLLRSAGSWLVDRVGSFFGVVTNFALNLFLLLVGIYYVLKDGGKFVDYLIRVAPIEHEYEDILFRKLRASVVSVVRGSIAIAVIQGVAAGLGFWLLGVPNSALWGSATMVASLIPIMGTALTMVPAVIYLVATGSITSGILLAVWGFLIVGFVDNAFRGQLMKKGMDIHPFLILLSVLGGLEFFGPIGFISGPLLLAVLAALLDIYLSYRTRADALDAPATLTT